MNYVYRKITRRLRLIYIQQRYMSYILMCVSRMRTRGDRDWTVCASEEETHYGQSM